MAHGCYIGTPSGTPAARPAHIRPCLALSPLGFSCVSMCDPTVRCILAHSDAFMCIHVSVHVSLALVRSGFSRVSMCEVCVIPQSGAFLRILTHSCALLCILTHPPMCTGIQNNALGCIKARMQHIRKCIKMRMHLNALKCNL